MTTRRMGLMALLALAVAAITAASTKMTDLTIVNSTVSNSTINSTPVGATTPSTGKFTTVDAAWLRSNGSTPTSYPAQGAYLTWNAPGPAGFGGTALVNVKGGGTGGFEWYNSDGTSVGTLLGYLDPSGVFLVGGDIYAGPSGNLTVHGTAFTGNAASSDHFSSTYSRVLVNQSLCTPGNSTDAACTGSVGFTALADASYAVLLQPKAASGAYIVSTITSKSASFFNYAISCTFNCGSVGTVTADVWLYHP
jgi:hypothetical protein